VNEADVWKEEFVSIYRSKISRNGSKELMDWLEASDFFTAPASVKNHLAIPGGLCRHSINVYKRLSSFLFDEYGDECPYSEETIAIVALLHDLCKVYCYEIGWKNQKTYDSQKVAAANYYQIKHDNAGDFIWETVPTYQFNEDFVYGHGEKSVFLIRDSMKLSIEEAQAIRYHMGAFKSEEARDFGNACQKNPLVFFLHMADSAAAFFDEQETA